MANKQISQLDPVTSYQNISQDDLFVMEQSNAAKKLTAGVLQAWLNSMVNGVGYIASIELTSTSGLTDTYTITFTNGTSTTFDVINGMGIVSVRSVNHPTPTTTNIGISFGYSDGTFSNEIIIPGGVPGQNGRNGYIHFAWSENYPTQDSDISFDAPNNYLGVCANNSVANPVHWTDYQWMYARGADGAPGAQGEQGKDGAIPWRATVAPTETSGKYYFNCAYVARGIPIVGEVPQPGDILFYQDTYYTVNKTIVDAQTGIEYAECRDPYQFTGGNGTYDYEELSNQPQINGVTLVGNKTSSQLNITAGLSADLKAALLQLAQKVAYIDGNGDDYYQDLYDALYPTPGLVSIDAVFTQGANIVLDTDSLNTLKQYLVVTATYDGGVTEVVPSTDYTLSGTLTRGTSTITATYAGKTDTFNVTVSVGLDSIAYGTKTYRDLFVTENIVSWYGDFEDNFVISHDLTYKDASGADGYKVATGSTVDPSVTTSQSNSPTHSIDVSTSGSSRYMNAYHRTGSTSAFGIDYIVAFACNVPSYTSGKVEFQIYGNSSTVIRDYCSAATDGWEPIVTIGAPVASTSPNYNLNMNFGAMGNSTFGDPVLTAYIDDLVVVKKPTGMTLEQAQSAYADYMEIVRRGS